MVVPTFLSIYIYISLSPYTYIALLMLYYCFTTAYVPHIVGADLMQHALLLYYCFTALLLLMYHIVWVGADLMQHALLLY